MMCGLVVLGVQGASCQNIVDFRIGFNISESVILSRKRRRMSPRLNIHDERQVPRSEPDWRLLRSSE